MSSQSYAYTMEWINVSIQNKNTHIALITVILVYQAIIFLVYWDRQLQSDLFSFFNVFLNYFCYKLLILITFIQCFNSMP